MRVEVVPREAGVGAVTRRQDLQPGSESSRSLDGFQAAEWRDRPVFLKCPSGCRVGTGSREWDQGPRDPRGGLGLSVTWLGPDAPWPGSHTAGIGRFWAWDDRSMEGNYFNDASIIKNILGLFPKIIAFRDSEQNNKKKFSTLCHTSFWPQNGLAPHSPAHLILQTWPDPKHFYFFSKIKLFPLDKDMQLLRKLKEVDINSKDNPPAQISKIILNIFRIGGLVSGDYEFKRELYLSTHIAFKSRYP